MQYAKRVKIKLVKNPLKFINDNIDLLNQIKFSDAVH